MTATNGRPGKPGVPLNPEEPRWHWVRRIENNRPFPLEWTNDWNGGRDFCWAIMGSGEPEDVAKNICYLGPCLTPDEAAKREDVKWHEGYAVGVLDVRRGTAFGETDTHYAAMQKRIAELEAALAIARRAAMEEAAKIADSCAADWAKSAIGKYINSKWDFQSRAEAGEEIAAAIRAAANEVKP